MKQYEIFALDNSNGKAPEEFDLICPNFGCSEQTASHRRSTSEVIVSESNYECKRSGVE